MNENLKKAIDIATKRGHQIETISLIEHPLYCYTTKTEAYSVDIEDEEKINTINLKQIKETI